MGIAEIIVIVIGLMLFETISSVDNAVVNADVLATNVAVETPSGHFLLLAARSGTHKTRPAAGSARPDAR
jgi:hypothetical protein